jgi:ATP-dependent DNA helicase PIF1
VYTHIIQGNENHRYEISLTLKKHMRVLLTKNLSPDEGLVNGSQGRIVDFIGYSFEKLPKKKKGLSGSRAGYCQHEIERFSEANDYPDWPVVEFDNGQRRTIYPDCLASEHGLGDPYSLISRTQVPLIAGYAITIHKAQVCHLDSQICAHVPTLLQGYVT